MRYTSFNVKGITDPLKANMIKQWLQSKGHIDIITLVEFKTKGEELSRRLNTISKDYMWLHSFHNQGWKILKIIILMQAISG